MIGHQNMNNMSMGYVTMDPYQQSMQTNQMVQNRNGLQNYVRNTQPIVQPVIQIPSRMTSSLGDIRPNEVPSDGTPALFLQNDYSCIYAKAINNQGMIDTVRYIPEPIEEPVKEEPSDSVLSELLTKMDSRLEKVDERFDNIEKILKELM